jgi:bleomycin hydrolase
MKNLLIISISFMSLGAFSQEKFETNRKGSEYKFKVLKDLEATDVQDQGRTSTCWSFSLYHFLNRKL